MKILFETPAGYAIFKLVDENKLSQVDDLFNDFESLESANKVVKLKHFEKFADTTAALAAATAAVEGKLCKSLKKLLKKQFAEVQEELAVADAKLGNVIKEKLQIPCISNSKIQELMRCIRNQSQSLLGESRKKEMTAMCLGLAHSLSRYKLKFSPDKIDTMIVQAVCSLDVIDKELNNYIMRLREWYGWHFPELGKIVSDNIAYVKTIRVIGARDNAATSDLSDVVPEQIEEQIKEAAEISMGSEISEDDVINIHYLCDQICGMQQDRADLYDYLKSRMMAIAPNLTVLVGDLVGAKLISHAGSLINLSKMPASTLQIIGAEKALFRALKTKRDTPKYGLIYHSQLVAQTSVKNKGKASRMLATKASLCARFDGLGEATDFDMGAEHKVKLESRLRFLEEGNLKRISGTGKAKAAFEKYHSKSEIVQYPVAADSTLGIKRKLELDEIEQKKPLIEEISTENNGEVPKKKKKKLKTEENTEEIAKEEQMSEEEPPKKKKKKVKAEEHTEEIVKEVAEEEAPKKKKKKSKTEEKTEEAVQEEEEEAPKKKKKKSKTEEKMEEVVKEEQEEAPKKKKKKKSKVKTEVDL